jgi:heptosyltransferase-2
MKILIILPNWLGDAVMTTPAIELLIKNYPNAKITFIGSYASTEALKHHPLCENAIIDLTKKASSRIYATYMLAKTLKNFSIVISFRNQIYSSLLLKLIDSPLKIARASWHSSILLSNAPKIDTNQHLVKQYADLLKDICKDNKEIKALKLYIEKHKFSRKTLGINAGATYGSAKRWYPDRFAQVAAHFSKDFDILIFGGLNEVEMAQDIEKNLDSLNITNYKNIAGKTNIQELCANIAGCCLFITNDSGPMHIAAAYQIPTVAIFGPTKYKETSQWRNKKSKIVRHDLECSPCMKRECPLKHHECMTSITAHEVIKSIEDILD